MKRRSFVKNTVASGFGTLCIIVPFVFSAFIAVVFLPIDTQAMNNIGIYAIDFPNNYSNMSADERSDYLAEQHDGVVNNYNIHWGEIGNFEWPPFGRRYVLFGDGTEITFQCWLDYRDGDMSSVNDSSKPNFWNVALSIMTLDPPALEGLGEYGFIIRTCMYITIAVGVAEILWW